MYIVEAEREGEAARGSEHYSSAKFAMPTSGKSGSKHFAKKGAA